MQLAAAPTAANPTAQPGLDLSWLQQAVTAAGTALQVVNQQKLAQINLKRAQQNLPPITLDQVPGAVPTVSVGIDPGTRSMLLIGGVAIAAFIAWRVLRKRR